MWENEESREDLKRKDGDICRLQNHKKIVDEGNILK